MITIYCFKSVNDEIIYIGSTNDIKQRYSKHKSNCYNENGRDYNFPLYQYMRDNNGFENFKFKKLCDIDEEYRKITEQFYIDTFKPKCNVLNVVFDKKKYDREHKENNKEYYKEYREKRKDWKKEYDKEYRKLKVYCEFCNCDVKRKTLERHKKSIKHINNL
jgi:hypothetical protein